MILTFSSSGRLLASGSCNGEIMVWDSTKGTLRSAFNSHPALARTLIFSLNEQFLATMSDDYVVKLWDHTTGTLLRSLESRSDLAKTLAFSPDGRFLASGSDDFTVRLWDIKTRQQLLRLDDGYDGQKLSFTADSTCLDTGKVQVEIKAPTSLTVQNMSKALYSLDQTQQWVTWKTQNVLWLPSDYRSSAYAMRDNILALGHVSGLLNFIRFDPDVEPIVPVDQPPDEPMT